MNAKKNPEIGNLAENVFIAIEQEKMINQDIHQIKGRVSGNIALIIVDIINEKPKNIGINKWTDYFLKPLWRNP